MNIKILTLILLAFVSTNVFSDPIEYTSEFIDNGNKVTEIRTFHSGVHIGTTQTWEWLDLTITNGISYNSLVADLDDDGLLNVSNTATLTANTGAIADINGLADSDRHGWNTQSPEQIIDLLYAFFNVEVGYVRSHDFGGNVDTVETFISMFGDTFHDLYDDLGYTIGVNGSGKNSGHTQGTTNLQRGEPDTNAGIQIFDGEMFTGTEDSTNDKISTAHLVVVDDASVVWGTWLARRAVEAPEPNGLFILVASLLGMVMWQGRKRNRQRL